MNVHGRFPALVCRWHRRTLSLLAADALAAGEGRRARAHLERCAACRRRFAEGRAVAELGRDLGALLPSVETPPAAERPWERTIRMEVAARARADVRAPSRPRWAWAGLAAAWLLIGVLRGSAPGLSPVGDGPAPITWGQVRMVLGLADGRTEARRGTAPVTRPAPEPPGGTGRDGDRGEVIESDNPRRLG